MTRPRSFQSPQGVAGVLVGCAVWLACAGSSQAQGGAAPAKPAAPPVKPPASAVPHVIRPSATLGPPAPGTTSGPAAAGAGPSAGGGAGTAALATPRLAGVARYRSVAKADAVMFDAPSEKARKIFLAPQGMPVEVISVLRTWVKVRDPLGDLAWISRDDLADRRMLMATTVAILRREAEPNSPTWFSVDRGVVLELLEEKPINGFLKVRYAEGQVGYLQPDQVWGL